MNAIKKSLGLVWIILGPLIIYFLVSGAIIHIDPNGKKDINNPVIWIIIITIFLPIVIGFVIFGYYAFKGEYAHLPESSEEIQD
jgi:uncharacterized Tic20 family protein